MQFNIPLLFKILHITKNSYIYNISRALSMGLKDPNWTIIKQQVRRQRNLFPKRFTSLQFQSWQNKTVIQPLVNIKINQLKC